MTENQEKTGSKLDELPPVVLYIIEAARELASERAGKPTRPTRADVIEVLRPVMDSIFGTEYEKPIAETRASAEERKGGEDGSGVEGA